jgi:tRNA-specific 2-thiouridylase
LKSYRKTKRVVVGFSGGVDSFYTAYLLKEQGYDVVPVFLRLTFDSSAERAKEGARLLGLKLKVVDLASTFYREVIEYFVNAYRAGLTPNPCAICNARVKFPYLARLREDLKADFIATGHYARVAYISRWAKRLVLRGKGGKEQSYFLSLVNPEFFERLLLPLGNMSKEDVRRESRRLGFGGAKESQDVCFVKGDVSAFLERFIPPKRGKFVLKEGKAIGEHRGYYHFTVGQRRGLGVSAGRKLYVVSVDPERNTVVLGSKEDVLRSQFCIRGLVLHIDFEDFARLRDVHVQVRYRSEAVRVSGFEYLKKGIYRVKLASKVKAPAPGQVCAFYSGDVLLGGGEIAKAGEE